MRDYICGKWFRSKTCAAIRPAACMVGKTYGKRRAGGQRQEDGQTIDNVITVIGRRALSAKAHGATMADGYSFTLYCGADGKWVQEDGASATDPINLSESFAGSSA